MVEAVAFVTEAARLKLSKAIHSLTKDDTYGHYK
jgi:hypothetical protein